MKEPRYLNLERFNGKLTPITRKNALALGFKGKHSYIVTLEKDEEGKNVMKIHTYVNDSNDIIEYVDDEFVNDFFKSLIFYS